MKINARPWYGVPRPQKIHDAVPHIAPCEITSARQLRRQRVSVPVLSLIHISEPTRPY